MDDFTIEAVHRILRGRRTLKPIKFRDQTIDSSIIEAILENANWAPTHGRTEPWRFQVYSGEARKTLAEKLAALYRAGVPLEKQKPEKLDQLRVNPLRASHVIMIWMKKHDIETVPEIEEVAAVACAVQNMQLTARAYGIACFWSTGLQAYHKAVEEIFDIKPPDRYLGVLYLGYPKDAFPAGHRKPVSEKVVWVETEPTGGHH